MPQPLSCEHYRQRDLLNFLVALLWSLQHLANKIDLCLDLFLVLYYYRANCSIYDGEVQAQGNTSYWLPEDRRADQILLLLYKSLLALGGPYETIIFLLALEIRVTLISACK